MDVDRWLAEALADGPMDTGAVIQAAKAERITRRMLREARRRMGVITEHYEDINGEMAYIWRLPTKEKTEV